MALTNYVKKSSSLLMKINRRSVLPFGVQSVCLGAQGPGQSCFVVKFVSDAEGSVRQAKRPLDIYPDLLSYLVSEFDDEFGAKQGTVSRQKR